MRDIELKLSKENREKILYKLQPYFENEFDYDLKNLEGQIFIDFLTKEVAPFFYNLGIEQSMLYLNEKKDDMYLLMKDE